MAKRPTATDAAIGERIRIKRKELGLSQGDLAASIGVSFQQVQKYENGANRVGGSRLAEIARALNAPVAFFFDALEGVSSGQSSEQKLLNVKGATELLNAYARIADPALRSAVVSLAWNLAQVDATAATNDGEAANG